VYPVHQLTQRYLMALGLLAALAIGAQVVIQLALTHQTNDSRVINIAGRQRMLSQQLSKDALALSGSGRVLDENRIHINQLAITLDEWTQAHIGLQYGDDVLGVPGNNPADITALFEAIEPEYEIMRNATECLLVLYDWQAVAPETPCEASTDTYIQQILAVEGDFLTGMNDIVFAYDAEARDDVEQLRLIQAVFLGVTILVLVAEAVYIFRPTVVQTQQMFETVKKEQHRYQALFEQSNDGVFLLDERGQILQANERGASMLGYPLEDMLNKSFLELSSAEQSDLNAQMFADVVNGKSFSFYETLFAHAGEHTVAVEVNLERVVSDGGELWHIQCLVRDITARKLVLASEAQYQKTQRELDRLTTLFENQEEKNQLTQRIISALSHDLRTPLTVVMSSKDILDKYYERMTPEKRREKFDNITTQIDYAMALLENTITMIRNNVTEHRLELSAVNVALLCQVSVNQVHESMNCRDRIHFMNKGNVNTAYVDEILLSRILLNLLSNAIKYSPTDTEVTLTLQRQQDALRFEVMDRGVGMSSGEMKQIFDPFYRAVSSSEMALGVGLGLSIVKDCVEQYGGTIVVSSIVGQGTTFTVTVPTKIAENDSVIPTA